MRTYVPYTETLSPMQSAHIRLSEARAVADAYGECTLRRKASWEAAPTPETWTEYQAAVHQFRAAKDAVRVADAALAEVLKERTHANAA